MLSSSVASSLGLKGAKSIYDTINAGQNRNQMTSQQLVDEMQNWFGPPQSDVPIGAHDNQAVQTYHLPDVFAGKSMFLRQTMVGMITRANEWPTTLALPWARTEEQNFHWAEFKFNNTLVGEVPHEGIPRLLTSSQRSFEAGTKRRGLAFLLEHGFWRTPQGRMMYTRNFIGIRQAVQETANFEVCYAISNARNTHKEYQREKGELNVAVAKLMDYETWSFAMIHKSVNGFDHMLGLLTQAMGQQAVSPNILIAPPGFRMYYQKLDPAKTQYWSFGPEGVLALKEGPEASGRIGGMYVVESRRLDLSRTEGPAEPFLKTVRHGEFYPFVDENKDDDHNNYSSAWRNITVWDEQATQYVKLTLRDAVTYSGRFTATGDLDNTHFTLAADKDTAGMLQIDGSKQNIASNPMMISRAVQTLTADRLSSEFRDMFLYKKDGSGGFGVSSFFGLMETVAATQEDFRMIARTAAQSCFGADWESAKSVLEELSELVHRSENIPYSSKWWLNVMRVNLDRQARSQPLFTNEEVAAHRREPRIPELMHNEFGGLDIPPRTGFADYSVPPHTNSWPALRTLASHHNTNSGWDSAAAIAVSACALITRLTKKAAEVFGSSLLINPLNRQPWFQIQSSETVLTNEVILAPRDGVFMRMIPNKKLVEGPNKVALNDKEKKADTQKRANSIMTAKKVLTGIIGEGHATIDVLEGLVTFYGEGDADAEKKLIRLVLQVATDNITPKAITEKDCKSARCRARRFIRQLGITAASKTTLSEQQAALRSAVEMLMPLIDQTAAPATIKAAQMLEEQALRARSLSVSYRRAKEEDIALFVSEKKEITEAEDNAAAIDMNALPTWAKFNEQAQTFTDEESQKIPQENDAANQNLAPVEITQEEWVAGYWIRVPTNSYKIFAETSTKEEFPLALPSNPELRHLAPIEPSVIGVPAMTRILNRPQYTVSMQKIGEAEFGASNVLEAMEEADIPHDVWQKSAPTAVTAAMQSSRKRVAAMESSSRPPQLLTAMLASIVKPSDRQPSADPYAGGYHPLETRDRETRDRRGEYNRMSQEEYNRWEAEHNQTDSNWNADILGGGGGYGRNRGTGDGNGATDAASKYKSFNIKFGELRREFSESVFVNRWKRGSAIADPIVRLFHQVFLGARIILQQLWDMIDNHIHVPVGAIGWRLNITRKMYQMPAMVGGFDTGATFYGAVDVLLGDDAYSKIHYANLTFNMVAFIVEGRNVGMAENAIANAYLYGNGTEWVKSSDDMSWDQYRPLGDIISTLIPLRETKFHEPMDIYGQFSEPDAKPENMTREERDLHYSSAPYTSKKFKLQNIVLRKSMRQVEPRYGQSNLTLPQTLAFQGWYASYDRTRGRNTIVHTPGKCHTGDRGVGPVAAAVFNGRHDLLPENINYADGN